MASKILVCGGRNFGYKFVGGVKVRDIEATNKAIDVVKSHKPTAIIQGCASGGDEIGILTAQVLRIPVYSFPADWDKHGKAAGPIRNQQMLDEGKPDLVIAFSGGNGTFDMIRRAKKAGVDVVEIQSS